MRTSNFLNSASKSAEATPLIKSAQSLCHLPSDVLSDVLRSIRLSGSIFCRWDLSAPWRRRRASEVVCGGFRAQGSGTHNLFSLLPPVIHIPGARARANAGLETAMRFLGSEAGALWPGAEVVTARLTDVLFVQVLRAWIEGQPEGAAGWLGALRDPQMAAALGHLHRDPARAWTVASLATAVGMSRSALAARFTALVGRAPMEYLLHWRMQLAATALCEERSNIAEIAVGVGYESEVSFSRAFKREMGIAPGAYRRRHHEFLASQAAVASPIAM